MSESVKQSFVLYFDAYPNIAELPAEQRGELFSALFEYAMDAAAGAGSMAEVLARHPDMGLEARMAFHFMGRTVQRDTDKWRAKHQRYREAALRRIRGAGEHSANGAWRYVDAPPAPAQGE